MAGATTALLTPRPPSGVAPSDLDAFVRFEFPYPNAVSRWLCVCVCVPPAPSVSPPPVPVHPHPHPQPPPPSPRQEEAQKDKTNVVKNTDSPGNRPVLPFPTGGVWGVTG